MALIAPAAAPGSEVSIQPISAALALVPTTDSRPDRDATARALKSSFGAMSARPCSSTINARLVSW